jgi:hypothetical protein
MDLKGDAHDTPATEERPHLAAESSEEFPPPITEKAPECPYTQSVWA